MLLFSNFEGNETENILKNNPFISTILHIKNCHLVNISQPYFKYFFFCHFMAYLAKNKLILKNFLAPQNANTLPPQSSPLPIFYPSAFDAPPPPRLEPSSAEELTEDMDVVARMLSTTTSSSSSAGSRRSGMAGGLSPGTLHLPLPPPAPLAHEIPPEMERETNRYKQAKMGRTLELHSCMH